MKTNKNFFAKLFTREYRSRLISFLIIILGYIVIELLMATGNLSSMFQSLLVPVTC